MTSQESKQFGQHLKAVRSRLGLMQKDFAAKISITPAFLSEIESGKSRPGFDVIRTIAETFNVNLHYLYFGVGDMFYSPFQLSGEAITQPDIKDEKFEEMLYYFKRAPVVKYAIYEFLSNYLHKNKDMIEAEMKKYDKIGPKKKT